MLRYAKYGMSDLQAIVLCGLDIVRNPEPDQDLPKPLVPIKGKPILRHILDHARAHSISQFIMAVGYKAAKIKDYMAQHRDIKSIIVDSGDADIIARIKDCSPHIKGDFLVLYGDTLSDVDLDEVIKFHDARPEKGTITVWPLRSQFGLLEVAPDGKVLSFKEKPVLDKWINIGYFYFNHRVLSEMKGFTHFEDFLRHLVAEGDLNAYRHTGIHITVNTIQELEEAEGNIEKIHGRVK